MALDHLNTATTEYVWDTVNDKVKFFCVRKNVLPPQPEWGHSPATVVAEAGPGRPGQKKKTSETA